MVHFKSMEYLLRFTFLHIKFGVNIEKKDNLSIFLSMLTSYEVQILKYNLTANTMSRINDIVTTKNDKNH